MAIDFNIGDVVVVDTGYVANSTLPVATKQILGTLDGEITTVTAVGNLADGSGILSYITVLPQNTTCPSYNDGNGVTVFFASDTLLNNSFEIYSGNLPDTLTTVVQNDSGSTITKGMLVYRSGFDTDTNRVLVGLARATSSNRAQVMGIALEDFEDGQTGSVLIQGTFSGLDLSAFGTNRYVYLSNTSGLVSDTPGTNIRVVGLVLVASVTGVMYLQTLGGLPTISSETAINASVETGLFIVRGTLNTDGTILAGQGFTLTPNSTGDVTVTFDAEAEYGTPPSITVSANNGASAPAAANNPLAAIYNNTGSAFGITRTSAGAFEDGIVSFIAIGTIGPS